MLRLDQVTAGTALGGVDDGIAAQPMGRPPAAESVLALAQAELLEFQSDALTETQEDLGFALGGRLRDNRRGGIGQDGARGRVLAQKLVAELAAVEAADLDSLLSGPQDWHWNTARRRRPCAKSCCGFTTAPARPGRSCRSGWRRWANGMGGNASCAPCCGCCPTSCRPAARPSSAAIWPR
ncbi:hypothetical protein [Chromobacterium piscinae]|uniref:hypothetical protein n=1 Tax=Chromobacterium piscinae TaxID=686831 RepID=UPI003208CE56